MEQLCTVLCLPMMFVGWLIWFLIAREMDKEKPVPKEYPREHWAPWMDDYWR